MIVQLPVLATFYNTVYRMQHNLLTDAYCRNRACKPATSGLNVLNTLCLGDFSGESNQVLLHVDNQQFQFLPRGDGRGSQELSVFSRS